MSKIYIIQDKISNFFYNYSRSKLKSILPGDDPIEELDKNQDLKAKSNIEIVIGDCGSGKSCYVALRALKWLKKGYNVYSNMYIEGCYQFDLDDLMKYDFRRNDKPYVIIIDEASSHGLGSRGEMHKTTNKQNIIEFFTMYRHYKAHMVYVVAPAFQDVIPIVRSRADTLVVLKRTLFKLIGCLKFKKVFKSIEIVGNKELGSEPKEVYYWGFLTTRYKFKFPAYKVFNTYSCKPLLQKTFKKY